MTRLTSIIGALDELLTPGTFQDMGPNGLQVPGRDEVSTVVTGVTASRELCERAVAADADLVLVHHGLFWDFHPAGLTPVLAERLRPLFKHDIALAGYHLPLDAHPEVGNNAELARRLGLEVEGWWADYHGTKLGVVGRAEHHVKFDYLVARYEQNVGPIRLAQPHGPRVVHKVAILSGFGIDQIDEAIALGCDTLITGETSHARYYDALEHNVNVLYGGHYSSETVGVQSLGVVVVRLRARVHQQVAGQVHHQKRAQSQSGYADDDLLADRRTACSGQPIRRRGLEQSAQPVQVRLLLARPAGDERRVNRRTGAESSFSRSFSDAARPAGRFFMCPARVSRGL